MHITAAPTGNVIQGTEQEQNLHSRRTFTQTEITAWLGVSGQTYSVDQTVSHQRYHTADD